MGKIVKFCSKCEESFDNKFSFCPNCAESLEAFEMKPVVEAKTEKLSKSPKVIAAAEDIEVQKPAFLASTEKDTEVETITFDKSAIDDDILELDVESNGSGNKIEMPSEEVSFETDSFETDEIETIVSATPKKETETVVKRTPKSVVEEDEPIQKYGYRNITASSTYATEAGDNFHITVVQDKNVQERNLLFLGAGALILALAFGGLIYSIFDKELDLAAIDSDSYGVLVPDLDEAPMEVDEPEKPKNDDKGGGGGGGGKESNKPTSKGQLATQSEQPLLAPSTTYIKKKSEIQYQATTQGNRDIKQNNDPYGDPNGISFNNSDGPGKGGGQGTGIGRGQGSGNGTGLGSGNGSGSGNGDGNGNGDGKGDGDNNPRPRVVDPPKPDPPKPAAGPSTPFKLLSKPRPGYTDAARQNNVQGTVTLRVTFLANGQIGSISPVSQLGYGLTEKAIAAARSMQFEPPQRNGVPYAVTKSVQFTFTMY